MGRKCRLIRASVCRQSRWDYSGQLIRFQLQTSNNTHKCILQYKLENTRHNNYRIHQTTFWDGDVSRMYEVNMKREDECRIVLRKSQYFKPNDQWWLKQLFCLDKIYLTLSGLTWNPWMWCEHAATQNMHPLETDTIATNCWNKKQSYSEFHQNWIVMASKALKRDCVTKR